MSKKRNNSDREKQKEQENVFLNRLAALTSAVEGRGQSALEDDLRECGIAPAELRKVAYYKLRRVASHNYSTLDKEIPSKLRDFLRQMRPVTPEEEHREKQTQAALEINHLLSNIRSGIASTSMLPATRTANLAHAFRNRKEQLTQRDRDLLNLQQSEIDAESDDEDCNDC